MSQQEDLSRLSKIAQAWQQVPQHVQLYHQFAFQLQPGNNTGPILWTRHSAAQSAARLHLACLHTQILSSSLHT